METIIFLLKLAIAILVLMRSVCLGSTVSRREWYGHPMRFIMLASSYALLAGGAIAWVFGMPAAVWLFAGGVSALILFDRRRHS